MVRRGLEVLALAAALAVGFAAAPARACDQTGCPCKHPATHTVAAKCSCSSQADCTCKKGSCKCAKCSGLHKAGGTAPARGA